VSSGLHFRLVLTLVFEADKKALQLEKMSSEIGVLNLFESSVEPRLVDGIIASDSEAENEVVHLANGKFENEDHLYDNLAFSLHKRATVSNKPDELMRNVADEESSNEKSAPDPDPRVDLLENNSATAVTDDFRFSRLRLIDQYNKDYAIILSSIFQNLFYYYGSIFFKPTVADPIKLFFFIFQFLFLSLSVCYI